MLFSVYRGRLVGAVQEAGGICFIEGMPGVISAGNGAGDGVKEAAGADGQRVVHVSDENLAGPSLLR